MDHDQEWRQLFLSELKEIKEDVKEVKKEMNTLKIKVAGFASLIGSVIGAFFNKLM